MDYLRDPDQLADRSDPTRLLPGARAALVVAAAYPAPHSGPPRAGAAAGAIAAYACGADYHAVIKARLVRLADAIADAVGHPIGHRACVDSAPVLERDLAERAGLGFLGKNTMLIVPGAGSYLLLGELLVDVDLAADQPPPRPRDCGDCRACLDACPTGALVAPYRLDARRCISYLTIENRRAIPTSLRPAIGSAVFGCDRCQKVCPYNATAARAAPLPELIGIPARTAPDLLSWLDLGTHQLRRRQRRTALRRINQRQLLRNLCVALGNLGDARAVDALARRLAHRDPMVRGHAAWALARLGRGELCRDALDRETDPAAAAELRGALTGDHRP